MNRIKPSLMSLLALLLFGAAPVIACSCFMDPNPPCRAVGSADAIFEGEVLDREKIESGMESYLRRRVTMKVRKAYKGSLGEAVYVYTGNGDSDCGYRFKIGSRYLVYAYEYDGRLSTSYCSRTRQMKYAKDDLDYLLNLPGLPSGVTIFGRIYKFDSQQVGPLRSIGFPQVKIEIDGPERKTILTDSEGSFSVKGLVAGQYDVKAERPNGFDPSVLSLVDLFPLPLYREKIVDKGCVEVNLTFEPKKSP